MDTQLKYPQNTECILNIENIQLKIWVDKSFGTPSDEQRESLPSEPYASRTMHRHSHAEIFCCPSGFLHINTDGQIIQLNKGDIAVIPSGIAHNMLPVIQKDYWAALRFQIIPVKRKDCTDLYSALHAICNVGAIKLFRDQPELTEKIRYIFEKLVYAENHYPLILSLFDILYQLTLLKPIQTEQTAEDSVLQRGDSDMQRYEVMDYFINKCYMYPLTPKLLAEQLYISERQISRIVQSKYGMSFHRVLLAKRIMVAEQMLKNSEIQIQEIALAVGFHSPDIFFREFKKKYGMTPREYRIKQGKTLSY